MTLEFNIEELKPYPVFVEVKDEEVELLPFNLNHEVYVIKHFKDLNSMISLMNKSNKTKEEILHQTTHLLNLTWTLIKDKEQFKNSKANFVNSFINNKHIKAGRKLSDAIIDSIINSLPRQDKIAASDLDGNSGEGNKICYANYYDRLAKRYGLSIDDFYNMTLRQVHGLLVISGGEEYKELEVKAAIAGRKLKPRIETRYTSREEEASNDLQAKEAVAELQKLYEERQKK